MMRRICVSLLLYSSLSSAHMRELRLGSWSSCEAVAESSVTRTFKKDLKIWLSASSGYCGQFNSNCSNVTYNTPRVHRVPWTSRSTGPNLAHLPTESLMPCTRRRELTLEIFWRLMYLRRASYFVSIALIWRLVSSLNATIDLCSRVWFSSQCNVLR